MRGCVTDSFIAFKPTQLYVRLFITQLKHKNHKHCTVQQMSKSVCTLFALLINWKDFRDIKSSNLVRFCLGLHGSDEWWAPAKLHTNNIWIFHLSAVADMFRALDIAALKPVKYRSVLRVLEHFTGKCSQRFTGKWGQHHSPDAAARHRYLMSWEWKQTHSAWLLKLNEWWRCASLDSG